MGTAIVITSGKGGTGKTAMTCGIGSALAKFGKHVLCLDMDVGLRNLDLALGMTDRALMDFTDVLFGRCTLARAAVEHPKLPGLFLLTAPVHFDRRQAVSTKAMQALMKQILSQYDFCLIDCPAGIGQGFHLAASCADRAILTVTNDTSALRDAQQVVLQLRPYGLPAKLVVNRVSRWMARHGHSGSTPAGGGARRSKGAGGQRQGRAAGDPTEPRRCARICEHRPAPVRQTGAHRVEMSSFPQQPEENTSPLPHQYG